MWTVIHSAPKVPQRAHRHICDAYLMHVLWRGPGEVQIGTDAGRSTILTGLTSAEEKVLMAAPRLSEPARERARKRVAMHVLVPDFAHTLGREALTGEFK